MKKIYISGKITDAINPEKKFLAAETALRKIGWDVINPMLSPPSDTWEGYMTYDIGLLFTCQAIYMLSDWRESKGARIEHAIAKEMGLTIIYQ